MRILCRLRLLRATMTHEIALEKLATDLDIGFAGQQLDAAAAPRLEDQRLNGKCHVTDIGSM